MDKELRRLQKISGSLFISLPKQWTKKIGVKKNSEIEIGICNDGSLRLSPKLKQEVLKKELVLKSSRYVARDIVKNSLIGTERIKVVSEKNIDKVIRDDIKWFTERLPNTEIIEEDKKRIIIQNFGYKNIPTKKAINRLLYLVSECFKNVKHDSKKELKNNFEDLRRFYFIIVTHIRTYLNTGLYVSEDGFTPLEAMDYRMFCEKIERIGLILRDFRINEKIKNFFEKTEKLFNDVKTSFLKKDDIKACEVWFIRDELVSTAETLKKNLDHEDKDKIKKLIRIIEYCKDMADLI